MNKSGEPFWIRIIAYIPTKGSFAVPPRFKHLMETDFLGTDPKVQLYLIAHNLHPFLYRVLMQLVTEVKNESIADSRQTSMMDVRDSTLF